MENELSYQIIKSAIEVHKNLGGCGLLESIYEDALCYELQLIGIKTKRQVSVPVKYKGVIVRDPLFLDILVEDKVIVEVKATEKNMEVYESQLLTYLRLSNLKLGLLLNFGYKNLVKGVSRVVNGL